MRLSDDGTKWLTVADVASRWSVTDNYVRRLIRERRIAAMKFGEARNAPVRISVAAVEEFEAAGALEPIEATGT
jgi:excisionase family DNA binding protein